MPNWKFPCIECKGPVKTNQKGLQCSTCTDWVHHKCTDLTEAQYISLEVNVEIPFYCSVCKPRLIDADANPDIRSMNSSLDSSFNISSARRTDYDYISAHSSDFELVTDESDSECRGLNFSSLHPQNHDSHKNKRTQCSSTGQKHISLPSRTYKYPCVVCLGPCKTNCQDSICCNLCDEWTHRKCSTLSIEQFRKYCLPENSEIPFWCDNCLYGSRKNRENQTCLSASEIDSLDTNDIYNLCPNSIFRDKDDIPTTEYFTTDELNVEIKKTPENLRLIHINAVSLCKHIISITNLIDGLEKHPSILFISETKVHDEKEEFQKDTIQIEGFRLILDNSPTNAGGTAIYASTDLKWNERPDIKFDFPNCEACFIDIECNIPGPNPVFGALYRHPGHNARPFCSYLGEFLEIFSERSVKLTMLGDINIDLNKTNVVTTDYINTQLLRILLAHKPAHTNI